MSRVRAIVLVMSICIALLSPLAAAQAPGPDDQTRPDLESIVLAAYSADAPGAAVIVVRNGKILYRGARGLANLELGVPLRPERSIDDAKVSSDTLVLVHASEQLVRGRGVCPRPPAFDARSAQEMDAPGLSCVH